MSRENIRLCFYLFLTIAVSFAGFASYSFVASRSVQRDLRDWLELRLDGLESLPPRMGEPGYSSDGLVTLPADIEIVSSWSPEGVFNRYTDQDTYPEVAARSVEIAFGNQPELLDWGVRYPFLIPAAIHLGIVGLLPLGMKLRRDRGISVRLDRPYGKRALLAAFYAYAFTVFFQGGRMLWGSWSWDFQYFGRYQYPYGPFALYLFFGLFIAMYLYCVVGTAGLQISRTPGGVGRRCIRCKYSVEGDGGVCQECGLEEGAWIPSRWRINHWYLGAMFVVTFFSPVLVASVYSVFG